MRSAPVENLSPNATSSRVIRAVLLSSPRSRSLAPSPVPESFSEQKFSNS